ncbi:hypothetical protein QQ045_018974 [Rhodiola kirilowii]
MDDADDTYMQSWTGTIIGPSITVREGRIYQLKLFCSKEYPNKRPSARFQSRVNMSCVNQRDWSAQALRRLYSSTSKHISGQSTASRAKPFFRAVATTSTFCEGREAPPARGGNLLLKGEGSTSFEGRKFLTKYWWERCICGELNS